MTKSPRLFTLLLLPILLLCSHNLSAQTVNSYLYENEFNFLLPKDKWTFVFGLANRGMLEERQEGEKTSDYQHEHLEVSQFNEYNTSEYFYVSLGFRYRWRETFDQSNYDEFRLIEQFGYEHPNSAIGLSHRFRAEQRFMEATRHRFRYELEISQSLSQAFSLSAATEAFYEVASQLKPEAEQRFKLTMGNTSFANLELKLSLQYRMADYAKQLENEYFVITEVNWSL